MSTTMTTSLTNPTAPGEPRLTSLSHGGGCGCKIAPGVLSEILKGIGSMPIPKATPSIRANPSMAWWHWV